MSAFPRCRAGAVLGAFLALHSLAAPSIAQERPPAESASPTIAKQAVRAAHRMVVAAHPLASAAGLAVLRDGGSAVDAAVAVQMVLTLVEPQSSGIGGGAFLVLYDAANRSIEAWDGRETAPAAATPDLFLRPDGTPMPFYEAAVGGRAVGIPGVLRMLEAAHRAHGRLPWAALFAPAIAMAENGFPVSARLHALVAGDPFLASDPAAAAYFHSADGEPLPVGHLLRNPALAETLRRIAAGGAETFYAGPIAADIVAAVRSHPTNPGVMTEADLAGYRPLRRDAICDEYRGYRLCGVPPPSSGPLAVLQILGMLERFDMAALAPGSVEAVHLLAEAERLAYADRARWVGDPAFVGVSSAALLADPYLAGRSRLIDPARAMGKAAPGEPLQRKTRLSPPADTLDRPPSTSHVSIVDDEGSVVAMTSSIENQFGARLMVRGFLLNNQLTDFAFRPGPPDAPAVNRLEPGKRPRSSMAPMIGFAGDGRPALAVGSPGGSAIIAYVAQTLVAMLDWGLDPQAAVDLPHVANRNGRTELEAGTALAALAPAIEALGHEVSLRPLTSGLHVIRIDAHGLVGGADPRRDGIALGD